MSKTHVIPPAIHQRKLEEIADKVRTLKTLGLEGEPAKNLLWLYLQKESQRTLARDLADFLKKEGRPEMAGDLIANAMDLISDMGEEIEAVQREVLADMASDLAAREQVALQRSRSYAARGALGGAKQGEMYREARRYFEIEVEGFHEDRGEWPTLQFAKALLEENRKRHGFLIPSNSTLKRWLLELKEDHKQS